MTAPLALLKQRDMTAETTMHTPGPWVFTGFAKASNFADHAAIVQGDNTVLARVKGGVRDDKETAAANARLIAAAPDLLGSLRSLLAFYEPGQSHLDTEAWKVAEARARRAVAAAEGRA